MRHAESFVGFVTARRSFEILVVTHARAIVVKGTPMPAGVVAKVSNELTSGKRKIMGFVSNFACSMRA